MTSSCVRWIKIAAALLFASWLVSCGFHLRGDMPLAPPLHKMYLQTKDPYGVLASNLESSLKMSGVQLTTADEANVSLVILSDDTTQELLSVGGTQQTRQYKLSVFVTFEVEDHNGNIILAPQTLSDSRVITIQSNQILGSSNEAVLYFQQMRRTLAIAIMYRLSSQDVTKLVNQTFEPPPAKKSGTTTNNKRSK